VKLALIMDKKLKYKMIVNLWCIIDTLQRRASAARHELCCRLFSRLDMHFKTRYNVTRIEHLFSSGQPYCNSTWLSQTDVLRTYVKQTRLQGIFTSENLSKNLIQKPKRCFNNLQIVLLTPLLLVSLWLLSTLLQTLLHFKDILGVCM